MAYKSKYLEESVKRLQGDNPNAIDIDYIENKKKRSLWNTYENAKKADESFKTAYANNKRLKKSYISNATNAQNELFKYVRNNENEIKQLFDEDTYNGFKGSAEGFANSDARNYYSDFRNTSDWNNMSPEEKKEYIDKNTKASKSDKLKDLLGFIANSYDNPSAGLEYFNKMKEDNNKLASYGLYYQDYQNAKYGELLNDDKISADVKMIADANSYINDYEKAKREGRLVPDELQQQYIYDINSKANEAIERLEAQGVNAGELVRYYEQIEAKTEQDEIINSTKELANEHPLAANALSVLSTLDIKNNLETVGIAAAQGLESAITGKYTPADNTNPAFYPSLFKQKVLETTSQNITDSQKDNSFSQKALPFLYNVGMSMVDSTIAAMMPGGSGAALLSLNAFTQGYNDAAESKKDASNAFVTAGAQGINEYVFEKYSLESVKGLAANASDSIIKKILKQSGIEFSEEAFTELANTTADIVINQNQSQLGKLYTDMLSRGYSEKEASKSVFKSATQQVLEAALAGAVSGGLMGGGASVIGKARQNAYNSQIGADMNTEQIATEIEMGLGKANKSKSYKLAKSIENSATKDDNGNYNYDGVSKKRLGELRIRNSQALFYDYISSETKSDENYKQIKKVIKDMSRGEIISQKQAKIIKNSESAINAINDVLDISLTAEQIDKGVLTDISQSIAMGATERFDIAVDKVVDKINLKAKNGESRADRLSVPLKENTAKAVDFKEYSIEATLSNNKSVYVSNKNTFAADGNYIKINTIDGLKSIQNFNFNSPELQQLADSLIDDKNIGINGMNTIFQGFTQKTAEKFNSLGNGVKQYYDMAAMFYNEGLSTDIQSGSPLVKPEAQFDVFIKQNKNAQTLAEALSMDIAREIYNAALTDKKMYDTAQKQKKNNARFVQSDKKAGEYHNETGRKSDMDSLLKALSRELGYDIFLVSGKAENGLINPGNREIYINEGNAREFKTVIHEITHYIKLNNAADYNVIEKNILDYYKDTYGKGRFNSLRRSYLNTYNRESGGSTHIEMNEEIVCDIMADMFATQEGVDDFAKWVSKKAPEEQNNIKSALKRLFDKIKSVFDKLFETGELSDSQMEFAEMALSKGEQMRSMWLKALDKATQNAKQNQNTAVNKNDGAIENLENGVEIGNTIKYSLSENAKKDVKKALNDFNYTYDIQLTDNSPSIITSQKGTKNLPMVMKPSHIRENIFTAEEAKKKGLKVNDKIHYHGLGEQLFLDVINDLEDVNIAYRETKNAKNPSRRENYFILISQHKDNDGNIINVPVYIDEQSNVNRVFIETNKISTVFGKSDLYKWLQRQVSEGNLVRIKNKSTKVSEPSGTSPESYNNNASTDSISKNNRDVNTKKSLDVNSEGNTLSKGQKNNTTESSVKYSYAGVNAKTSNKVSLSYAKTLENEGVDGETIRQKTGWFKGYDGKWRFEINDSDVEFSKQGFNESVLKHSALTLKMLNGDITEEEFKEAQELSKVLFTENHKLKPIYQPYKLSDYIKHNELFEAYPMLKNVTVAFDDIGNSNGIAKNDDILGMTITLSNKNNYDIKSTLLHEVQHLIQAIEGFSQGSSPSYFNSIDGYYNDEDYKKIKNAAAEFVAVQAEAPDYQALSLAEKFADLSYNFIEKIDEGYDETELNVQIAEIEILANAHGYYEFLEKYYDAYSELHNAKYIAKKNRNTYKLYRNTAGEIEARDVQTRLKYSSEQRKNTRPDIDRTDVVFADVPHNVKYSLAENFDSEFEKAIDVHNKYYKNNQLVLGKLPPLYSKFGIDTSLDMTIRPSHLREIIKDKERGTSQHGLNKQMIKSAILSLANPAFVHYEKDGTLVVTTTVMDKDNLPISVFVSPNQTANYCDVEIDVNRVKSMYAKNSPANFVNKAIEENRVMYAQKNKVTIIEKTLRTTFPDNLFRSDFKKNISQYKQLVNKNMKFSLDVDSDGNTLSQQQQEYFKDSKVRDENGNLLVVYHGSVHQFNTFDITKSNAQNLLGHGFYFTNDESLAREYGDTRQFYLDVKKPIQMNEKTIMLDEYKAFCNAMYPDEYYEEDVENDYELYSSDYEMLLMPATYLNGSALKKWINTVVKTTGFDGVIEKQEDGNCYFITALKSSQAKNTDNLNPTSNPDVRYSRDVDNNYITLDNVKPVKVSSEVRWRVQQALNERYRDNENLNDYEFVSVFNPKLNIDSNFVVRQYGFDNFDIIARGKKAEKLRSVVYEHNNKRQTISSIRRNGTIEHFRGRDGRALVNGTGRRTTQQGMRVGSEQRNQGQTGYDKGNSDSEQGTVEYSLTVEEENVELKSRVQELEKANKYLKQEFYLSEGWIINENTAKRYVTAFNKRTNSHLKVNELAQMLREVGKYGPNGKFVNWNDFYDKCHQIAENIVDNRKAVIPPEHQEILDYINSYTYKLSESQKAECAAMYGSYGKFHTANFGKLKIRKDARMYLDEVWQEWAEAYPYYFDKDINHTDMALELVDLIDSLKDTTVSDYNFVRDEEIDYLTTEIMNLCFDLPTRQTFADKKQNEINKLKQKHKEQLDKLKVNQRKRYNEQLNIVKNKLYKANQDLSDQLLIEKLAKKELIKASKESARETDKKRAYRRQIRSDVNALIKLLDKPDKNKHIPGIMRESVNELLSALNDNFDMFSGADENQKKNLMRYNVILRNAVKNLQNGWTEDDGNENASLAKQNARAYDIYLSNYFKSFLDSAKDKSFNELDSEELKMLKDILKATRKAVDGNNKLFADDRQITIDESVKEINEHFNGRKHDKLLKGVFNSLALGSLKPIYLFEMLDSDELTRLYKNIESGEDIYSMLIYNTAKWLEDVRERNGYRKWDFDDKHEFTLESGNIIDFSLDNLMAIYANSLRDDAKRHLLHGGFKFGENVKAKQKLKETALYVDNDQKRYTLSIDDLAGICSLLTPEQKAYVQEVVGYMSTNVAQWGNSVTRRMYDIELFNESAYYPIITDKNYIHFSTMDYKGMRKLANSSFTKSTVEEAKNPIVLMGFEETAFRHIEQMAKYSAFTEALTDFDRVYHSFSHNADNTEYTSVKSSIEAAYGKEVTAYIDKLLDDINGNVIKTASTGFDKWLSRFKKGAVLGSLSTVIQQPSAVARALSEIDAKYFTHWTIGLKNNAKAYEELIKYAPVAFLKQMGSFDTGTSSGTVDYLIDKRTVLKKIDNVLSFGAEKADEVTWVHIWNACINEARDIHKDEKLTDEQIKTLAGKRFSEVIRKTQVYDSTFSRSQLMRNNDVFSKMVTSFMAEPTTSLNMAANAIIQLKRKKISKKSAAMTMTSLVLASVLNVLLKSLVYAARDDDKDKTYFEKYISLLPSNFIDEINPINNIAVIKDIYSIFKGYDIERADISCFSAWYKAFEQLDNDKIPIYKRIENFVSATSKLFGVPVGNVMRDFEGVINIITGAKSGNKVSAAVIESTLRDNLAGSFVFDNIIETLFGVSVIESASKNAQLYKAVADGDEEAFKRLTSGKNDEQLNTAVKNALIAADERIAAASIDYANGNINGLLNVASELEKEGFEYELVVGAVKGYKSAMQSAKKSLDENDMEAYSKKLEKLLESGINRGKLVQAIKNIEIQEESDKTGQIFSTEDLSFAIESNNQQQIDTICESMQNVYIANGYSEEEAEAKVEKRMIEAQFGKTKTKKVLEKKNYAETQKFINDKINEYQKNGSSSKQAKSYIKRSLESMYKTEYINADANRRADIITIITNTGLYGGRESVMQYLNNNWK